jgi:hypothetical protein
MKFSSLASTLAAIGTLSGCAHHQMMRGSVAMKATDREAHVCLGNNEVKVGDHVTAYRNECRPGERLKDRGVGKMNCALKKLGDGKVVSLLNEHYSTVEFDPGVPFEEGTVVQKE